MLAENKIVHTLWVGKRLSLMECLSIRLLQQHGHEVHLWAYENIENVPEGTIIEDASLVMSKESIFEYRGKPLRSVPNGGIGSLAHWSDQFQMNLLYKFGGVYSQLDVAYLKPLDFQQAYAFAPGPYLGRFIQTFLMKCPKASDFAKECSEALQENINAKTISSLDWYCSMKEILLIAKKYKLLSKKYIIPKKNILDLGGWKYGPFFEYPHISSSVYIIHWSNATNRLYKDNPIPGSYYEYLLYKAGLIKRWHYIKGYLNLPWATLRAIFYKARLFLKNPEKIPGAIARRYLSRI